MNIVSICILMQDGVDEMIAQLSGLIEEIVKTAKEDKVISEDEEKLISEVSQRIEDLKMLLSLSLENADDLNQLEEIFDQTLKSIVSSSIETAKADNVISADEIQIIRKVIEFSEKNRRT